MKRILVLGCGGSAGINYIKSLRMSSEHFYIVGLDVNKYYIEMSPVDKRYHVEHKKGGEEVYIEKINTIIKKEGVEFVHSQPDPEVKILSDYREKINAKTFLPSKKAVDISHDKWKTHETLSKASVPVAKTLKIKNQISLKDAFAQYGETIWLRATRGAGGKASLPVKTITQATMWIDYWGTKGLSWNDFLASEVLTGIEVSWLSIWKDGKLVCSQGKQRFEWVNTGSSPSGVTGTTAIQRTVHDEEVNRVTTNAVLALDSKPTGIYVVDTKRNKDGIPCVMEINPGRFFTTSLFFPTAGVNMPHIYTKLAYGEKVPKLSPYNSVEKDIYWMRIPDAGPVMVREGEWTSIKV